MKRLTIEQAENSPMRVKFGWRVNRQTNNVSWYAYTCHEYSRISYPHISNFINSYIGKSYNICYSDFLHKVKESHIKGDSKEETISWFKEHFANFSSYPWRNDPYIIDSDGLIQKNPNYGYHRPYRHKITYYKLANPNLIIRRIFFYYFNSYDLYEKACKGMTRQEWEKICYIVTRNGKRIKTSFCDSLCDWLRISDIWFASDCINKQVFTVYYAKPALPKNVLIKQSYEKHSKDRKQAREQERKYLESFEKELHSLFHWGEVRKQQRILEQQAKIKAEERLNIITRDRLGFDETSFKTYR